MRKARGNIPVTLPKSDALRPERIKLLLLTIMACLGVLYLAPKILSILHAGSSDYFDFELFWRAGKSWVAGQNPYDGIPLPSSDNPARTTVSTWFYPPYWYPLITPFGLLPFPAALTTWKILNFFLLILSTHLLARTLADVTSKKYLMLFTAGTAFISFMYATAVTAWSGQSSILVYFGMAALIFGLLKARMSMVIVGLIFLALKPQIGFLAFVAVASLRRYRWAVLPAGLVCLFSAAAVVITANLRESITGFLTNLTRHSEHSANTPPHLTGAIHILDALIPLPNASIVALGIFFAGVAGTAIIFHVSPFNAQDTSTDAKTSIATLILFMALSLFIVPLHHYDMVALAAVFMMTIAAPLDGRWLIGFGLFLCYRPDFIWRALGVRNPEEIILSHLISPGLLLILIGAAWSWWSARARAVSGTSDLSAT